MAATQRTITPEEMKALVPFQGDPKFVPVEGYATLVPLPDEVGSLVSVDGRYERLFLKPIPDGT